MTQSGADLFVDCLEQYDVTHLFGNPGTTELPVMEALGDSEAIDYVLGLHEDAAVGAAAGYAQTRRYQDDATGGEQVGVVNLHVTPGLAHGLGNLYDASVSGAPMVVTTGDHATDFRHEEPILQGDLLKLAEQFCKWSAEVSDASTIPAMVRRAFRVALTPPTGPVFLALPMDAMMAETDDEPQRLGAIPDAGRGDPDQVAAVADALVDADQPVLVVGDGVARSGEDAVDAVVELAEATGARVHTEILASEVDFPSDHDQFVSPIPPTENLASMLLNSDTLCFVGCSTNTTLWRHENPLVPDHATCVHVSQDAWEVGKNEPADAAVIGDPGRVCAELADQVAGRVSDDDLESRLDHVASTRDMVGGQMASMGEDDAPDDPRSSKAELVDAVRDAAPDAYVVDEAVTTKFALLTRWDFAPESYIANKGGGLGYGLPAAVGAALAEDQAGTDRPTVAVIGDGSYLYYPQAIYGAIQHGLDLTVVVPNNQNYRILKDNTNQIFGGDDADHDYVGMDIEPPVDIVRSAESYGALGVRAEGPDELEGAVAEALDHDGVSVLDALVHD